MNSQSSDRMEIERLRDKGLRDSMTIQRLTNIITGLDDELKDRPNTKQVIFCMALCLVIGVWIGVLIHV